jgi:hypothetical protein
MGHKSDRQPVLDIRLRELRLLTIDPLPHPAGSSYLGRRESDLQECWSFVRTEPAAAARVGVAHLKS